tara:strand:+ start:507 stop:1169 length:663 start_codon:yes stop_codon:yes gene_type:complete
MAEMLLSLSIGDKMKKKVRRFLDKKGLVPIVVFTTTDPAELDTGYSEPSKIRVDLVMIYKDNSYHLFQRSEGQDFIFDETRVKSHQLKQLKPFLSGSTLVSYDLKLVKGMLKMNSVNTRELDILSTVVRNTSARYSLFNLAFWNGCDDSSRLGEAFALHHARVIADWANGYARSVVKKLQGQLKYISNLTYRIKVHGNLVVKKDGKRTKIQIKSSGDEEE